MTKLLPALLVPLALAFGVSARADDKAGTYPSQPITIVYPGKAGSSAETILRAVSEELAKRLGQPILVKPVEGAAGSIGVLEVVRSKPDGYTLVFGDTASHFSINSLRKNKRFDYVDDLAPITKVTTAPAFFIAGPDGTLDIKTLFETIKSKEGKTFYGANGVGSLYHLMLLKLLKETGVAGKVTQVQFKGSPETVLAVQRGDVSFALNQGVQNVSAGRVKALAVASSTRYQGLPDVPTVDEALGTKGFNADAVWWSLLAPKKTPAPIVARLNKEVNEVLKDPALQERFGKIGYRFEGGTPEELDKFIRDGIEEWGAVARSENIVLE